MIPRLIVVFGSFLIYQIYIEGASCFLTSKTKGHVEVIPKRERQFFNLYQYLPKFINPENHLKDGVTKYNIPFVAGKYLLVKCVKDSKEAKVFIYGPEGYLIDIFKPRNTENVCNQVKEDITRFSVTRPTGDVLKFKIKYKIERLYFSGNFHQDCLYREYIVTTHLHYAKLDREKSILTDCINGAETPHTTTDYFLPSDTSEIMDYKKIQNPVGEPITFNANANSKIKMNCQQYTEETISSTKKTTSKTMARLFITYEDVILDTLFLDRCTDEGIYINRVNKNTVGDYKFTLVFKRNNFWGKCYKTHIFLESDDFKERVRIRRTDPYYVSCPKTKDWTSNEALKVEKPIWFIEDN
ncbi:uncharacterized protein LOC129004021 [Macrosteles quadrilineatus]|uniref:uncharacterized protein LOC129004021 n=1 Tax=Macrosteles quadrilineatus TaxID=74068 RepID=UPI0023E0F1E3|nr:uncharacterized protein LOC129004021 [Macrosteles quadrilineatus]